MKTKLTKLFVECEKASGVILILCTVAAIAIANSPLRRSFLDFWHIKAGFEIGGLALKYGVEHWINDGLIAIFFLLIGLEIERQLYIGKLSDLKSASLPIFAAIGGMATPALFHFLLKSGIHATLAGVLLAFATPFARGDDASPSYQLQHLLHKPVAFVIMPLFALANTGIVLSGNWMAGLTSLNTLGIFAGLVPWQAAGHRSIQSFRGQNELIAIAQRGVLEIYHRCRFSERYRVYHVHLHHTFGLCQPRSHPELKDCHSVQLAISGNNGFSNFKQANRS